MRECRGMGVGGGGGMGRDVFFCLACPFQVQ